MSALKPAAGSLVSLTEIIELDRWALESRARSLSQAVYLGDDVALCRMLGRYKLYVDTKDIGFGAHLLLDGVWEIWLTQFMARLLKPGMSVVDIGANHGYYTLLFGDIVGPTGRVVAVEPHPDLARLMRRSVGINGYAGWVEIIEKAAMAEDDTDVSLRIPVDEPKNSHVLRDEIALPGDRVVTVAGARASSMLAHWDRVDFIKIDAEGAEEAVIAGLSDVLERHRPHLLLEFNGLRCMDAAGLLDRLEALYGLPRAVDFDSVPQPVSRARLLDPANVEDWMIYFKGS